MDVASRAAIDARGAAVFFRASRAIASVDASRRARTARVRHPIIIVPVEGWVYPLAALERERRETVEDERVTDDRTSVYLSRA